mmetsp:Transcript_87843/g.256772  ORF Transcript_87843/g.256772 Transcript_87843/m.256772 type:complete len:203 (+) Transcript_87843:182-790(+)
MKAEAVRPSLASSKLTSGNLARMAGLNFSKYAARVAWTEGTLSAVLIKNWSMTLSGKGITVRALSMNSENALASASVMSMFRCTLWRIFVLNHLRSPFSTVSRFARKSRACCLNHSAFQHVEPSQLSPSAPWALSSTSANKGRTKAWDSREAPRKMLLLPPGASGQSAPFRTCTPSSFSRTTLPSAILPPRLRSWSLISCQP